MTDGAGLVASARAPQALVGHAEVLDFMLTVLKPRTYFDQGADST